MARYAHLRMNVNLNLPVDWISVSVSFSVDDKLWTRFTIVNARNNCSVFVIVLFNKAQRNTS